ncbi:hypothetical protein QFC19_000095 [Naganishia cerealis]|uniref:Uncharacterized protein n=1 Tax=Naganishia cerealis TaxID=610337 RepID=A0ACC2WR75_9TREE|nr:hypothetical protein QFC19_000095 [Naganishia cerealis]
MCGRFALGVPVRSSTSFGYPRKLTPRSELTTETKTKKANEIRAGVVHHFPRLLGNPDAAVARAQQGEAGRSRQRADRQRRRARQDGAGRGSAPGGDQGPSVPVEEEQGQEEELDWPETDEEPHLEEIQPDEEVMQVATARLRWENEERFRQGNYNVAPRSNGVVLRLKPSSSSRSQDGDDHRASGSDLRLRGGGALGEFVENGGVQQEEKKLLDVGNQELVLETMQWGLIPHWSKHPPSGALNTINARSENLMYVPSFARCSPCLLPRSHATVQYPDAETMYYEWQKRGLTKIPHFTKLPPTPTSKPHLMLLAGLYDMVKYVDSPASEPPIKTFTILTTRPSPSLGFLHDRMPCILESEEDYPVPTEVGKIGNNSPSFVLPVKERKDGIANFFKKQTTSAAGVDDVDTASSTAPAASIKSQKKEQVENLKPAKSSKRLRREELEGSSAVVVFDDGGSRLDKKPRRENEENVHSPVSPKTIHPDFDANKGKHLDDGYLRHSSGKAEDKKPSTVMTKQEEKEFELGIGDDSNAPNPHHDPTESKGKETSSGRSIAGVSDATSTRQTRSSSTQTARRGKQELVEPALANTTTSASIRKRPATLVQKEDEDDEIQLLSSSTNAMASKKQKKPRASASPHPTSRKSATHSPPPRETKLYQTEKRRSGKPRGGATTRMTRRGGTAEDGLENTRDLPAHVLLRGSFGQHQTRLDGFLKHDE